MYNQQKEHPAPEQADFPYKTYDEILLEKQRRLRFHRGLVVMSGIFLMFCAILIGISMIWNRTTNPLGLFQRNQPVGEDPAPDPSLQERDFTLAAAPLPAAAGESGETALYAVDVSGLIKEASAFVVEVEAESYGRQLTCRSGSGVVLSENGYILTDDRIIRDCDSISVTLCGGESCAAFVIGSDSASGVAVLKVDASGLTAAQLGDSDLVEVGQVAVAMGSTSGSAIGIISGVDWSMEVEHTVLSLLQTSASINAGNSGGPLLNRYGQVVGMNVAGLTADGYQGIGFALPINLVRPLVEELVRSGDLVGRPMMGITGKRLSAMAAGFYGLPQGILVTAVNPDSSAWTAGLQAGDVITHLDGSRVTSLYSAAQIRDRFPVGASISVTYCRRGVTLTAQVSLMDQQTAGQGDNF